MRYRGEITVFLSLTILCVMSLMLGLLESARTAGARLYLRMASDSAVSSVMSYYNRNLWDRYQLLYQSEYDGIIAGKASQAKTEKVTVCGKCCEIGRAHV